MVNSVHLPETSADHTCGKVEHLNGWLDSFLTKKVVGKMFNYTISFCALAVITYLIQFHAYRQTRSERLSAGKV
jgi:hypothetical protein